MFPTIFLMSYSSLPSLFIFSIRFAIWVNSLAYIDVSLMILKSIDKIRKNIFIWSKNGLFLMIRSKSILIFCLGSNFSDHDQVHKLIFVYSRRWHLFLNNSTDFFDFLGRKSWIYFSGLIVIRFIVLNVIKSR